MKQIDDLIKKYEASLRIVSEAAENAGDEKDSVYMRDKRITIKKFIMSLEELKKSLKQPKRLQHTYAIDFTFCSSNEKRHDKIKAVSEAEAIGILFNKYDGDVSWQNIEKL